MKIFEKIAKYWLDKFLDELGGKELKNEKLKDYVYSFLDGIKLGMGLAEIKYEEEDLYKMAGVVCGYIFSAIMKEYYQKEEKLKAQ